MRGWLLLGNVVLALAVWATGKKWAASGGRNADAGDQFAIVLGIFILFNVLWLLRRVPGRIMRSQPLRMFRLWMNAKEKELEGRSSSDVRESRKPR